MRGLQISVHSIRIEKRDFPSNIPRQMDISKQVNLIDSRRLNMKNNEDYSKFLEISNRKTAIFRDIIIESECKYHI